MSWTCVDCGGEHQEGSLPYRRPEPAPPAHDAPVEEWRAYARSRTGFPEGTSIDTLNRSQIRTLLGIPHGGEES